MIQRLKKKLYFLVAGYFGFWARFVLWRWRPRIVVVTGSSGKTTVLHLIEAQLGEQAVYSHHANSAIGLPFHILGMKPNVKHRYQWLLYVFLAPCKVFRKLPATKLYIVEADCDRPHEGAFTARLLKPEVTLWVSVYRTHSMNFDDLVAGGKFKTHEQAIAYEFGWFAAQTSSLVIANDDQAVMTEQLNRIKPGVAVTKVSDKKIKEYRIEASQTTYVLHGQIVHLPGLHPRELGCSIQMVDHLLSYLGVPLDPDYAKLHMPPGRSSIFKGKNDSTIIDSTYNTGLGAMTAILQLFKKYPAKHKWLVLGDILEQGSLEADEHVGLAKAIADLEVDRVILLGPRTQKYTYPQLRQQKPQLPIESFESPKAVLDYLQANLTGGETLLFKGGRFLEGVIEQLLENPADAGQLVRRESSWVKRRQKWGLPR